MQLFTIGTVLLNEDGTFQRDSDGNEIDAYSTLDIMNFARAWTGFDAQKLRGNFENNNNPDDSINTVDPMRIVPEWRDKFPKTDLIGGMYLCDNRLRSYVHLIFIFICFYPKVISEIAFHFVQTCPRELSYPKEQHLGLLVDQR